MAERKSLLVPETMVPEGNPIWGSQPAITERHIRAHSPARIGRSQKISLVKWALPK
jgi:hypothetical protein